MKSKTTIFLILLISIITLTSVQKINALPNTALVAYYDFENDTVDHVNGYKSGPRAGLPLYQWLISNNYPEGFQILCSNCNQGKRRNHNVCPHEEK